jgi:hypothetical protein
VTFSVTNGPTGVKTLSGVLDGAALTLFFPQNDGTSKPLKLERGTVVDHNTNVQILRITIRDDKGASDEGCTVGGFWVNATITVSGSDAANVCRGFIENSSTFTRVVSEPETRREHCTVSGDGLTFTVRDAGGMVVGSRACELLRVAESRGELVTAYFVFMDHHE